MTIIGMLGLMFWLNWGFTLVAVAVTPLLLLFVMRFERAVKEAQELVKPGGVYAELYRIQYGTPPVSAPA